MIGHQGLAPVSTASIASTASIDAGRLSWNVKSTFRAYVESAGGTVEVGGGAELLPDSFVFPASACDRRDEQGRDAGELRFTGWVLFTAHGGALQLRVSDPWIHRDAAGVRLSIGGSEATRTAGGRLTLAELTLAAPRESDGLRVWDDIPAALVPEGAVAFDFRYPPGTDLATLIVSQPAY